MEIGRRDAQRIIWALHVTENECGLDSDELLLLIGLLEFAGQDTAETRQKLKEALAYESEIL